MKLIGIEAWKRIDEMNELILSSKLAKVEMIEEAKNYVFMRE